MDSIKSLLQQATTQGSRSTALNPVLWIFGIIISAICTAIKLQFPLFIIATLCGMACVIFIFFIVVYSYFMVKNPDALRSEKFTLSKMAIERSITGDNISGFIDPQERTLQLPVVSTEVEDN